MSTVEDVFAYMEKYRASVALLRRLEWAATTPCQYFGVARTCPLCRGIDPSDTANASSFRESEHGHRRGCALDAALSTAPLDTNGTDV